MHTMAHLDTHPVLVLTTIPASAPPDRLARLIVSERLGACVNVLPSMRSLYRWEGAIEDAAERQLVIKTSRDRLAALEARVRAEHPYAVPEFLVLPVEGGSEAYLAWVCGETRPTGGESR